MGVEDIFDSGLEGLGDLEGQRQRRIVLRRLYRIDCLSGHADPFSEIGLGPAPLGAEHSDTVLHW